MPYTHATNVSETITEFPNSFRFNDFVQDKTSEKQTINIQFRLKALTKFRFYYLTLCNCPTYDAFVTKELSSGFIDIEDYDITVNILNGFCKKKSYDQQQLFPVCIYIYYSYFLIYRFNCYNLLYLIIILLSLYEIKSEEYE